jgi:antitoxin ParD1/3/4
MNVSLTPELEKMVNEKVESGLFNSASEVIRAGLRLLVEQDELKHLRFEALKKDLHAGLEQEAVGEVVSGPEVFKKLRAKHERTKKG